MCRRTLREPTLPWLGRCSSLMRPSIGETSKPGSTFSSLQHYRREESSSSKMFVAGMAKNPAKPLRHKEPNVVFTVLSARLELMEMAFLRPKALVRKLARALLFGCSPLTYGAFCSRRLIPLELPQTSVRPDKAVVLPHPWTMRCVPYASQAYALDAPYAC